MGSISNSPSIDVIQIGAREHYSLPLMLDSMGSLRYLHTDFYIGSNSLIRRIIEMMPISIQSNTSFKKALSRNSSLPKRKVKTHCLFGIYTNYKKYFVSDASERASYFSNQARYFSKLLKKDLEKPADITIGFRGVLPIFEKLRGRTLRVLSQIDGGWYEVEIMKDVLKDYPEWIDNKGRIDGIPIKDEHGWLDTEKIRLNKEWLESDVIVCNSKWTVYCMEKSGVPKSKLVVIPIPYYSHYKKVIKQHNHEILNVGFLGTLTMRKGIHILCAAARQASEIVNLHVVCAGVFKISKDKFFEYRDCVEYIGNLPRSDIDEFFSRIDVLALPSMSEGFGIVQLEAMARGIPVISSDRTGDIVINGKNGLRVKAGSVSELSEAFILLAKNKSLLSEMKNCAVDSAKNYNPDLVAMYWHKLIDSNPTNRRFVE
jgi:glycosyltransferase involved in cell wall biosynthesis